MSIDLGVTTYTPTCGTDIVETTFTCRDYIGSNGHTYPDGSVTALTTLNLPDRPVDMDDADWAVVVRYTAAEYTRRAVLASETHALPFLDLLLAGTGLERTAITCIGLHSEPASTRHGEVEITFADGRTLTFIPAVTR